MATIGRLQDATVKRFKSVEGELHHKSHEDTMAFLLDFYITFKARGVLEVFAENAVELKRAIAKIAPEPMLRKMQITSIREALDELERGKV